MAVQRWQDSSGGGQRQSPRPPTRNKSVLQHNDYKKSCIHSKCLTVPRASNVNALCAVPMLPQKSERLRISRPVTATQTHGTTHEAVGRRRNQECPEFRKQISLVFGSFITRNGRHCFDGKPAGIERSLQNRRHKKKTKKQKRCCVTVNRIQPDTPTAVHRFRTAGGSQPIVEQGNATRTHHAPPGLNTLLTHNTNTCHQKQPLGPLYKGP